jgi:hypothetical protein
MYCGLLRLPGLKPAEVKARPAPLAEERRRPLGTATELIGQRHTGLAAEQSRYMARLTDLTRARSR